MYKIDAAYTSQECSKCHHIDHHSRQGDLFKCMACGHQAHADDNASGTISDRRSVPGTQKLTKTNEGLEWVAQGQLPWLPSAEHQALKDQGIRFPALWKTLSERTWGETKKAEGAPPCSRLKPGAKQRGGDAPFRDPLAESLAADH
jgi:hypothetical protein